MRHGLWIGGRYQVIGHCLTCDKRLTGKQRYYCCDAHRKRYDRMRERHPELFLSPSANRPQLSAFRPTIDQIVRKSSANVRESSEIIVFIRVDYNHNGYIELGGFRDGSTIEGSLVKTNLRRDIAKYILEWLRGAFPEYTFEPPRVETRRVHRGPQQD